MATAVAIRRGGRHEEEAQTPTRWRRSDGELARETAEVEQYWIVGDRPEPRKPPKNVKPRFDAYKAISLQIREIFAEYTPIIEPLSLDEAYLDVTENLKGIVLATQIAEEIRATIRAETGLTASAGVSYNKFLAKLASDHRNGARPSRLDGQEPQHFLLNFLEWRHR